MRSSQSSTSPPVDDLRQWGDSSSCKCGTAGDSNKASNRSTLDSLAELLRQRERATIGGLELGELLGRGSFGRVYKGKESHCPDQSLSWKFGHPTVLTDEIIKRLNTSIEVNSKQHHLLRYNSGCQRQADKVHGTHELAQHKQALALLCLLPSTALPSHAGMHASRHGGVTYPVWMYACIALCVVSCICKIDLSALCESPRTCSASCRVAPPLISKVLRFRALVRRAGGGEDRGAQLRAVQPGGGAARVSAVHLHHTPQRGACSVHCVCNRAH